MEADRCPRREEGHPSDPADPAVALLLGADETLPVRGPGPLAGPRDKVPLHGCPDVVVGGLGVRVDDRAAARGKEVRIDRVPHGADPRHAPGVCDERLQQIRHQVGGQVGQVDEVSLGVIERDARVLGVRHDVGHDDRPSATDPALVADRRVDRPRRRLDCRCAEGAEGWVRGELAQVGSGRGRQPRLRHQPRAAAGEGIDPDDEWDVDGRRGLPEAREPRGDLMLHQVQGSHGPNLPRARHCPRRPVRARQTVHDHPRWSRSVRCQAVQVRGVRLNPASTRAIHDPQHRLTESA